MISLSKMFGGGRKDRVPMQENFSHVRHRERYAPGTEIAYDDQLIARFEGHHKSLLKLFDSISLAAAQHDYDRLRPALKKFLNVLELHVLEENLKLYVYLEKCIDDEDHKEMMHDMKLEMGQIGRTVRAFVHHHLQFGVNEENVAKFRQELENIGNALGDRIRREEDGLYSLYMSPRSYAGDSCTEV